MLNKAVKDFKESDYLENLVVDGILKQNNVRVTGVTNLVFLSIQMLQPNFVENIKTPTLCSVTFFLK